MLCFVLCQRELCEQTIKTVCTIIFCFGVRLVVPLVLCHSELYTSPRWLPVDIVQVTLTLTCMIC